MDLSLIMKPHHKNFVIVLVVLVGGSLIAEIKLARAEQAVLRSHQMQWACWRSESSKAASCMEVAKRKPEDANYCEVAVAACATSGVSARLQEAEGAHAVWRQRASILRLALVLAVSVPVLWFALSAAGKRLLHRSAG